MSDYEGHLPPAAAWQDLSYPYVKNEAYYRCWLRPRVNPGYAFNQALGGAGSEVQAPEKTPLIYESRMGKRNAADRLESFVTPHGDGKGVVAFVDGHVALRGTAPRASDGLRKTGP